METYNYKFHNQQGLESIRASLKHHQNSQIPYLQKVEVNERKKSSATLNMPIWKFQGDGKKVDRLSLLC